MHTDSQRPIVFIATNPWGYGGGSEYLWQETAMRLVQRGRRVVVCVQDHGELTPELLRLRQAGAAFLFRRRWITREDPNPHRLDWRERFGGWFGGPLSQYQSLERIAGCRPALVVVNQCENADGAWCVAGLSQRGLPFVTLIHNGGPQLWPNGYDADLLADHLPHALANYFCSRSNLRWLETQLGIRIPNAGFFHYPPKAARNVDCPWPTTDEPLRVAMVGRLDPKSKGHDLVIALLARDVWRERPVTVDVFGDGHQEAALKRLVGMHGVSSLGFRGHVADVTAVWRDHHVLLQPSRHEGLPNTLTEAMRCARPAVVTDVGGNAELVEEGVSGFIARHADEDSVADAMERCWDRRHELCAMGLAARRRVESVLPADPAAVFADELLVLAGTNR